MENIKRPNSTERIDPRTGEVRVYKVKYLPPATSVVKLMAVREDDSTKVSRILGLPTLEEVRESFMDPDGPTLSYPPVDPEMNFLSPAYRQRPLDGSPEL